MVKHHSTAPPTSSQGAEQGRGSRRRVSTSPHHDAQATAVSAASKPRRGHGDMDGLSSSEGEEALGTMLQTLQRGSGNTTDEEEEDKEQEQELEDVESDRKRQAHHRRRRHNVTTTAQEET